MDKVIIRKATAIDAACIARLSRKTFYETFAASNTPENMGKFMNEQFTEEMLSNEVVQGNAEFLLAVEDDVALGYAKLQDGARHSVFGELGAIEISRIYVDNTIIGRGVGKQLMDCCIEIARNKGRSIIWLGVWEHNQRAISFYSRAGFLKFGEHEFVLGNDVQTDWLMMKHI